MDPSGYSNIENEAITAQNVTRQSFLTRLVANLRPITFNKFKNAAKYVYDTICCLDKAWSVLGLALDAIAIADPELAPAAAANDQLLSLIDAACTVGCGGKEPPQLLRGKGMHKGYDPYPGVPQGPTTWQKEYTIPGGYGRADAVNWALGEIRELKPNNPRQIAKGLNQLRCYKKGLERLRPDITWKTFLDLY